MSSSSEWGCPDSSRKFKVGPNRLVPNPPGFPLALTPRASACELIRRPGQIGGAEGTHHVLEGSQFARIVPNPPGVGPFSGCTRSASGSQFV